MYRIIGADGREYGPISADQLRQWIVENRANAATQVLAEGATEWKSLGSLPEFSGLFSGGPSTLPGTPAVFPTGAAPFPKTNGFAAAGLILGILSVTVGFCCCSGFPFSILGLIFSIIGLAQIRSDPQRYTGRGVALAGLILCVVSLLLSVIWLLVAGASASMDQIPSPRVHRL